MPTLTVYPDPSNGATTVDGLTARDAVGTESWATIHDSAGNLARTVNDPEVAIYFNTRGDSSQNQWNSLVRCIYTLDTSALGSGATISAATFSLNGTAKTDIPAPGITPNINIYAPTPASNNNLATGDYNIGGWGATAYSDTSITYANWSTTGYNDFAFNATGIAAISKTSITKLGTRNAQYDVANVSPTWSQTLTAYLQANFADAAGTATDPKLVITYTVGVSSYRRMLQGIGI